MRVFIVDGAADKVTWYETPGTDADAAVSASLHINPPLINTYRCRFGDCVVQYGYSGGGHYLGAVADPKLERRAWLRACALLEMFQADHEEND